MLYLSGQLQRERIDLMSTPISDWATFRRRLARTLDTLPERCYLIIRQPAGNSAFVQFTTDLPDALLRAELVDDNYPAAFTDRLRGLGFTNPADTGTWTRILPYPSRDLDYAAVTQACVLTLRDAHHIASPQQLRYHGWRNPGRAQPGVTYYPGDLEAGDVNLQLPELGLEHLDF